MGNRFVRVRIDRPDGSSFDTTVTEGHADVLGLRKLGGRAVDRSGTPLPAKQVVPLGAPTAPAGGSTSTTTKE